MTKPPIPTVTAGAGQRFRPAARPGPASRAWLLVVAGVVLVVLGLMGATAPAALAAGPFTVNTTEDTPDGNPADGNCLDAGAACSLRAAVEQATASGGTTTINLPPGTYALPLGELKVGSSSNTNITLTGTGAPAGTIINQTHGSSRIFNVDYQSHGNVTFSVQNVTLRNGVGGAGGGGGAILGGGVGDTLNVTNVVFLNNRTSSFNGGAISFTGGGTLNVQNSTFTNNQSPTGNGGAIHFVQTQAGSFQVGHSTFTNNSATGGGIGGQGGAINAGCTLCNPFSISTTSFVNNTAVQAGSSGGQGGAIMLGSGVLNLQYNRIVGNTALGGGTGIYGGGGTVAAATNWWGCNGGPGAAGCDTAVAGAAAIGTVPWIVLTSTANPNPIFINQSTTLTAGFSLDSNGGALTIGQVNQLIGLPVAWGSAVKGVLSSPQTTIQATGTATALFSANAPGTGSTGATVDNGTATASITINDCTLIPPQVGISRSGTGIMLNWTDQHAVYEVYESGSNPYLTPATGVLIGTGQGSFLHTEALAPPHANHFYVIKAICNGEATSNRAAAFHFGLTPGQ